MLTFENGMFGLPKIVIREVYDSCCKRVGKDRVALITGEENTT